MHLTRLKVSDLRNLAQVSIEVSGRANLVYGANGSGKTSFLEAIHLLSVARSFRSQQTRPLIREGGEAVTVFGEVDTGVSRIKVGVRKGTDGRTELRVGGKQVRSVADMATLLPVQFIGPESHGLMEGGPRERRALIDWALFHVEHGYLEEWRAYTRALRQRNAILRGHGPSRDLRPWGEVLVEHGQRIDARRREYVAELAVQAAEYVGQLLEGGPTSFEYLRGWHREKSLAEALAGALPQDEKMGHTSVGPHRADLRILAAGRPAMERLSRGQRKLLVCALRLAQVAQVNRRTGKRGVVLVDDLPSELDKAHRERLLRLLASTGSQVFITAIEADALDLGEWQGAKMFHVEQGRVQEVV